MSGNLVNFLITIAENPEKFQKFQENPADYLEAVDLSLEAKQAILNRNQKELQALVQPLPFFEAYTGVKVTKPPKKKKKKATKKKPAKKKPAKKKPAKKKPAKKK